MTYLILMGLAGLFGLFYLFRTTDIFARIILAGQVVAIGLTKKGFAATKKTVIIAPTIFAFLTHLFQIQHYPGAGLLGLTMLLPIIAFIILTTTNIKNYKNELGFLTIIAVDAAIEFARRIEWIIN